MIDAALPSATPPGEGAAHEFTEAQLHRYARHIVLPEVGGAGQARLLRASVLVLGAGGLGAPLLLYLAAAGIGRITVVDDDQVDLGNLQRQVIHGTADLGRPKVDSAAERITAVNPEVRVERVAARLDPANASALLAGHDVVADGSDSLLTRRAVAGAAWAAGIPLVSAAVLRFDGQLTVFDPRRSDSPCFSCLHPELAEDGMLPSCAEAGVFGALAGALGSLQAVEVLKLILGVGRPLVGRLLLVDALDCAFHSIRLPRDPDCRACGGRP